MPGPSKILPEKWKVKLEGLESPALHSSQVVAAKNFTQVVQIYSYGINQKSAHKNEGSKQENKYFRLI